MIRVRENVGQRPERSVVLENFRGVDLTSSPLRVDSRRAVRARNLVPESGRNVKRRGWRQEAILSEYDSATGQNVPLPVRGMWWFVWSEGGVENRFMIVHAGERLYVSRNGGRFGVIRAEGMGKEISDAFAYGKRLYLVGHGEYLVFGTWNGGQSFELRSVADDRDTYVPRTTMAINPDVGEDGAALKDTRRSFDAVNLLSSRRINTCMGRRHGGNDLLFKLDGECADLSDVQIRVELADGSGGVREETWSIVAVAGSLVGLATVKDEAGEVAGSFISSVSVGESRKTACLRITKDCPPPLEGRDNITVTFKASGADAATEAAKIGGCRFGVIFGGGGNANRLFLSGNPDYPNYEFYSYWQDPTYFPDNGWNAVGTEQAAIVGFSRISDGVLAVFKEDGRGEPVIYYQTAEDEPVYGESGNVESMRFKLFTDAGNAGEGMISRHASADFYGDPLILSRNGVFGITYKTNVETTDRYAVERSRNIRAKLVTGNLSTACGAVWRNQYWLAVDGTCYVADAGYTCQTAESSSEHQYEWWILDNLPAKVMCVAEGCLWFGTDDGRICRVGAEEGDRTDTFRDITWESMLPTTVIHDVEDMTRLIVSDEAFSRIRVGDRLFLMENTGHANGYALWLSPNEYTVVSNRIVLNDPDSVLEVRDGITVYADEVGQSGLAVYTPYTVGEIDRGWGTFALLDKDGQAVEISEGGFTLGIKLEGRQLYVVERIPDEEDGIGGRVRVSLYEEGTPLTMISYGLGILNDLYGRIIHVDTVTAEWYTPVLDLGDNTCRKTLTRMTVATEPGCGGRVSFGYDTRAVSKQAAETGGMGGLDLTALDFREFSFSAFAASWTTRVLERGVNYIQFRWRSEEASDCRVDSITARYKLTGNIRGGL